MTMTESNQDYIKQIFTEITQLITNSSVLEPEINNCVGIICETLKKGKKIILFGNGGSAADAQHIAAEFVGRFNIERKSYPAIALTTDSSIITSISNDYSFEQIFSRQCESIVSDGDVVIGISTSGNSKNVINALKQAKYKNLKTISLTGKTGGNLDGVADITIKVPSNDTQRIQESHIMIG